MIRKIIKKGSDGARPQKNDAVVKPVTEAISRRFRPKVLANQPVIGRIMAFATRYEVSVQVASSVLAEGLPAMCCSDTLTTVVSSTSMKVLDMTATAISHGLMSRSDWLSKGICMAQFQTVCRDSEMNPILELHRRALFQFDESFWRILAIG